MYPASELANGGKGLGRGVLDGDKVYYEDGQTGTVSQYSRFGGGITRTEGNTC